MKIDETLEIDGFIVDISVDDLFFEIRSRDAYRVFFVKENDDIIYYDSDNFSYNYIRIIAIKKLLSLITKKINVDIDVVTDHINPDIKILKFKDDADKAVFLLHFYKELCINKLRR